jgi:hypothetical protein
MTATTRRRVVSHAMHHATRRRAMNFYDACLRLLRNDIVTKQTFCREFLRFT